MTYVRNVVPEFYGLELGGNAVLVLASEIAYNPGIVVNFDVVK